MTTTRHDNFINGQWLAGNAYSPNINPSNLGDVVGEYTQGDAAQLLPPLFIKCQRQAGSLRLKIGNSGKKGKRNNYFNKYETLQSRSSLTRLDESSKTSHLKGDR